MNIFQKSEKSNLSSSKNKKLKLYTKLAKIYDKIYQKIFDYEEQANLIEKIFRRKRVKNILDVGCGTGHLTNLLTKKGYNVIGLDLNKEMLDIAKNRFKNIEFLQGDMRNLKLRRTFDAIVMLGRSITYMTTNDDLLRALKSFNRCLKKRGILLFDFFNAEESIRHFNKYARRCDSFEINGMKVTRKSDNEWYLKHGVTWVWNAIYEIIKGGKKEIYKDESILRAFFKEEIETFLKLSGFKVIKYYSVEKSDAVLAEKIKNI